MKFFFFSLILLFSSTQPAYSNKIRSNLFKNYVNINVTIDQNKEKKIDNKLNSEKTFIILKLIFGTIFLFTLISFYRIYEDINELKRSHITSKYCNVIEFDQEKMNMQDVEEQLTFVSGKVSILETANDDLVKFKKEEDFIRIKREVCVFNYLKNNWEEIQDELCQSKDDVDYCYIKHNENIKISYEINHDYIFPYITTRNFEGKVQLKSINLSPAQIRSIQSNEKKINISDFRVPNPFNNNLTNTPTGEESDQLNHTFNLRIKDDDIFIDAIGEDKKCCMRIRYYGYYSQYLSVLSEVKDGSFKTYRIPFDYNKYRENDLSRSINLSDDMKINSNINCDIFNVILCLCLSGPPTYTYDESNVNEFDVINPSSINWVIEEETSLEEVLQTKHLMTKKRRYLNELLFYILFLVTFVIFWELIHIISNILGIDEDFQKKYFVFMLVTVPILIQIIVNVHCKISKFSRNLVNMSVCCGIVIFGIIILSNEITRLL